MLNIWRLRVYCKYLSFGYRYTFFMDKKRLYRGTWVAQSPRNLTLDFRSWSSILWNWPPVEFCMHVQGRGRREGEEKIRKQALGQQQRVSRGPGTREPQDHVSPEPKSDTQPHSCPKMKIFLRILVPSCLQWIPLMLCNYLH